MQRRAKILSSAAMFVSTSALRAQTPTMQPVFDFYPHDRLDLVTRTEPGVRHRCRSVSAAEASVVCHEGHGVETSLANDDIATIIGPPRRRLGASDDHRADFLLYQRPGTPLTVKLRR